MEPFWTIQGRGKQRKSIEEKIFISRNWKDFDQDEIVEELQSYRCKYFPNFASGLGHAQSVP